MWSIQEIYAIFHLEYDLAFNEVNSAFVWVDECKDNYYNSYEL